MSERDGTDAVVWPRSERTVAHSELATRLDTLEGKTVCQLWDYLFRGDEIFPMIEGELARRYPGIHFVPYTDVRFHPRRSRNARSWSAFRSA